MKETCTKP